MLGNRIRKLAIVLCAIPAAAVARGEPNRLNAKPTEDP